MQTAGVHGRQTALRSSGLRGGLFFREPSGSGGVAVSGDLLDRMEAAVAMLETWGMQTWGM